MVMVSNAGYPLFSGKLRHCLNLLEGGRRRDGGKIPAFIRSHLLSKVEPGNSTYLHNPVPHPTLSTAGHQQAITSQGTPCERLKRCAWMRRQQYGAELVPHAQEPSANARNRFPLVVDATNEGCSASIRPHAHWRAVQLRQQAS